MQYCMDTVLTEETVVITDVVVDVKVRVGTDGNNREFFSWLYSMKPKNLPCGLSLLLVLKNGDRADNGRPCTSFVGNSYNYIHVLIYNQISLKYRIKFN